MNKYSPLLILCVFLICACQVDNPVRGKWQIVKEVFNMKDSKMDSTQVKTSNFIYDVLNFQTSKNLLITVGKTTSSYTYSIDKEVLEFSGGGRTTHFGIVKVSKDSLVLYRKENWGNNDISISSTLHFKKVGN
jgi:hypothetical protein